jgi:hypothetical protein
MSGPEPSPGGGGSSCHWNDLGNVTRPGYYRVKEVGVVEVRREDLDEARRLGGNPVLRLGELNVRQDHGLTFGILSIRSSDREETR